MPRERDVMPRGALRPLILSVLADESLHGYALGRRIEERAKGAVKIRESSLYPALHELELEGAITAAWTVSSGRRRRVYSLTRHGRKLEKSARSEWLAIADLLHAMLAT